MKYSVRPPRRRFPRRLLIIAGIVILLLVGATLAIRQVYFENLKPVGGKTSHSQLFTVESGASVDQIAKHLSDAGLIRGTWAFKLYVSSKGVREALEAGTYSFDASQSVPEIVSQLTHGKVAADLVTIVPGQRIDQIRTSLINYGFTAADVDAALNPANYAGHPALVDKPVGASLEGYIYPDSYQKIAATKPRQVIANALQEMDKYLTPELRAAFAQHGLSTYDAITLASIVEEEVPNQSDRAQVAQVLLKRKQTGMMLGSDPTAFYGAVLAGQKPSVLYDSPYNTRMHTGLPPTPISNVSASALRAMAYPANTDWLYFVAGDDGVTHFSHTLAEHEAATKQYCHKLCGGQ